MAQLLDDNSHNKPSATPAVPRVWYFGHAAMVTGLFLFIALMVFGILPFLPSFIEKPLYETLLPILIFGIYGITFYTYYKGFKWDWVWSFFAASFTFFFSFILTMSNLETLESQLQGFFRFFSSNKDFPGFATLGLCYNILMVPCTEVMMVLAWVYRNWRGK